MRKAKQEPARRFHFLYDKVWREDILALPSALSRGNGGAPGVDREAFTRIESYGVVDDIVRAEERREPAAGVLLAERLLASVGLRQDSTNWEGEGTVSREMAQGETGRSSRRRSLGKVDQ